ncbi:MAG: type IX secretion system sortase PorU [Bacteroidetes bacterium]|nr:type IX secretion system sortase PorU [Bacteroidota bacterium]
MKNWPVIVFVFFLFFGSLLAQENRSTYRGGIESARSVLWETPQVNEISGLGKHLFIYFDKAEYDLNKHLLPIYTERIALPFGTSSASARVFDEQYTPLSDAEKSAINSYDAQTKTYIKSDIKIEVAVSMQKKRPYAYVQFIPIRKNESTGTYEKLVSFSIEVLPVMAANKRISLFAQRTYALNSVLATGDWYKISVTADGIYKMDYSFFKKLGLDSIAINPNNIRFFGNGGGQLPFANAGFRYDDLQENAVYVYDGGNPNVFDSTDYVLFYGQSQHRWKYNSTDKRFHHNLNIYSDTTYYFINVDLGGTGKRIAPQSSSLLSPTNTVTAFNDYQFHEVEAVNLLQSGRKWFGETFDILTSHNFTFNFSNIDLSSNVCALIDVAARRDSPGTDFYWTAGSGSSTFNIAKVDVSNMYGNYYQLKSDTLCFVPSSGTIPITITKTSPSPSIGWLNYIEVNARRHLTMTAGGQLIFRDMNSTGAGKVSQFIIANASPTLQVWEVTDPINVKLQQGTLAGNNLEFILPTDSLREFVAYNGQSFLTPQISGKIETQDLHGMAQTDLIIVTYPLFLQQANALAVLHRTQDSMHVEVATTEQIYNEFSSGAQDVCAIRDFVKMFYDRAADSTQIPKYLMLFGRGSYNLKSTVNNTNYVPAYESLASDVPTTSYPSDDFYGMLDDNEGNWDVTPDVLDLGIGRLPVKTISEADIAVNKITKYTSVPGTIETGNSCSSETCYGLGDWMNTITFCADDEDGSSHLNQADAIAAKVDTVNKIYNIDKIYLDAYQQVATPGGDRYPDATAALNRRMDKGGLIVNYTGHGGALGLTHERFLEIYHINSWKNQCKLPFFFTATCDFSVWDNPGFTSAGELTFLNPEGGMIGLFSTTRVVYSQPNYVLNTNFFDYAFKPLPNGKMPRMGDLEYLTKTSMPPNSINHRNFSLLADPALSLHYPKYDIITTGVNGAPVNIALPDTGRALSQMTVKGEVRDKSGNLLTNFNGIIYPTVYDKAAKITTLGNDNTPTSTPSPQRTFLLQKNILFKGKASVTNGKFSFSFVVPKDIAYNFGKGRISYYAHNGFEDASGYFEDFIIGGTDTAAKKDVAGPTIKLFLNDEKFVYGGTTNEDPKIFAVMSDSSGINTAGTGIGHDLTAILDNNITSPLVLNDYYESDMNSYKKGTIRYPLTNLTEGSHTLSLKVWDVYNNSSSSYTEFIVASSAQLALKHVLNYPNPFTTKTSFYFEHNQCCTSMDVQIQIFTVSGKLVKTIHRNVTMEGYRSDPIDWDGTDDYGDKIGRGVYIYRLWVKTSNYETAEQFEKLVILK